MQRQSNSIVNVCSREPHPRETGDDGRATIGQSSPLVGSKSCSRHCRLQRLLGADEGRTVCDLKAHRAVILPLISEHGGRIVRATRHQPAVFRRTRRSGLLDWASHAARSILYAAPLTSSGARIVHGRPATKYSLERFLFFRPLDPLASVVRRRL